MAYVGFAYVDRNEEMHILAHFGIESLKPISFIIKNGTLRCFGRGYKDDRLMLIGSCVVYEKLTEPVKGDIRIKLVG